MRNRGSSSSRSTDRNRTAITTRERATAAGNASGSRSRLGGAGWTSTWPPSTPSRRETGNRVPLSPVRSSSTLMAWERLRSLRARACSTPSSQRKRRSGSSGRRASCQGSWALECCDDSPISRCSSGGSGIPAKEERGGRARSSPWFS
ncbi:MAG: hypothetical protein ACK56F_18545, partial [bacterium]